MFDDNFEVFLADTPESKEIHYSIRYKVYCEEMGFENKEDFPQKQEFDEYDDSSTHFIVRNKHTESWVGAMRLIFKKNQPLPIEKNCSLDELIDYSDLFHSVELSRLCLVKEVRRRVTDIDPPHGITDDSNMAIDTDRVKVFYNHHRNDRSIIWGLLYAATEFGYNNKIQKCYFLTTPALARAIHKGGLIMQNIGAPCYHNGERYPFKMNVVEIYHSEIWNDYKNGYRQFSELNLPTKLKVA
jgi:N-acyl amino acid synthase of PEP-CTERM/exosortase system